MKLFWKNCLKKKQQDLKPGAILDAVISQSSASANKCLLYKLADFKTGNYYKHGNNANFSYIGVTLQIFTIVGI